VAGAFLVAAVLWWAYFDWLAAAMERALGVVVGPARSRAARDIFTLGHIPLIAGVVLYAVAAEEAVAHPADHLEPHGRTLLALAVALAIGALTFLAYRSDRFIAWERLAAGALAIAAVLGLQDLSGGAVLWVVAILIGAALTIEKRRVEAHRSEAESGVPPMSRTPRQWAMSRLEGSPIGTGTTSTQVEEEVLYRVQTGRGRDRQQF
jgi:low temperature requirement protein LtrA